MDTRLKHLYADMTFVAGTIMPLARPLARRLSRVLRCRVGERVALFNGRDGLWAVEILNAAADEVKVIEQLAAQPELPEVWLYIALTKRDAMDRVLRQATEMGVTHIQPVQTARSVADKLNVERVETLLLEATEQCERLHIPQMQPILSLEKAVMLERPVYWCAEHVRGGWQGEAKTPAAILVGPEGGFADAEKTWLAAQNNVVPVGLGTHILRVDTAVVAALSRFYNLLPTAA